jgi:hypothetical protein
MRRHWPAGRFLAAVAALLMITGVLTALVPAAASAAACQNWTGVQPPSPGASSNLLVGVAVLSPCNVWAVGSDVNGSGGTQTLTEHWNGSSWTAVPSPNPGISNHLFGVDAVSPTNIWAVGDVSSGTGTQTLILHWNGTSWKQVPSLSPGSFNRLVGTRVVSASDVWAVGFFSRGTGDKTLILHWNGTSWKQVPSPSRGGPGSDDDLFSVAALARSNAWAVGEIFTGGKSTTLILHWNGSKWARVPSPSPGHSNELFGVDATSPRNAWAVGLATNGAANQTLVLHWNGSRWNQVASPNQGGAANNNALTAVTATSTRDAWAVGYAAGGNALNSLLLHWNGTRWARVSSPKLGQSSELLGVAAASASNAWAVGAFTASGQSQALAMHCC